MAFPLRIALATRNPGKVREVLQICSDWPVAWVTYRNASWPEIEEAGSSYLDNALLKARGTAGVVGIPAVADDSGIEVDALGGEPGPRSARFAGAAATDKQNLDLLISRLKAVPDTRRTARYRCVAACVWPDGGREIWTSETCEGTLLLEPRGRGGFGYDPIFVPAGTQQTMAELSPDEKNAISHRGKALRALEALIEGPSAGRPGG